MATNVTIRIDKTKLEQLTREVPSRAGDFLYILAAKSETHIKMSMNPQSPSPEGQTPGIDTGALVNSIQAEKISDTESILHDGVDYGVHLEYGTVKMRARPFFASGIEETVQNLPDSLILEVIK